jgi:ubiquinone/menaquinone biosynthesis C-methylase UbiE
MEPAVSTAAAAATDDPWELAYMRFETPEEEIGKFIKRLKELGADKWPRDAKVVELFCGRGNGLHALERLGFTSLEGIDLSPRLVAQYEGIGKCYVGDCRSLPFEDKSKDAIIIQGGLHHLLKLPDDLDQTLAEVRRVLKDDGKFLVVEPWLTPFLSFVHAVCEMKLARRMWGKLDALSTMIHYERETYEQWLNQPKEVNAVFQKYFKADQLAFKFGKMMFVGRKNS